MTKERANTISGNGPAPNSPASLYSGKVMHHRMKPTEHRFSYSVFSLLIDLDRFDAAERQSRFFSINRFNVLSFHERDHGARDGTNLRQYVEGLLRKKSIASPSKILLLAYPRLLGYGFNPLSVYYAYDNDERLTAMVYEVRNTFGGIHTYTLPIEPGQLSDAGVRQDQSKEFYVSPFVSMEQHYHFRMLPPGKAVRVRILENDSEGPLLSATFAGDGTPLSSRSLVAECVRVPFLTAKVILAIHWEAFKIWLKRVPFHPRPNAAAKRDRLENQPMTFAPDK
ncbi:DUF1365 domain-containing protein [uncultured Roseibium sp.]|uniref:DUF1365 domain-containing protein n=1 Tax=uncultured Roseibium sp. TaxID=1936171 RepID=UPI0026179768|nr:DUF1365 domain-containing protein [uncultured Roseibium sp.]